MIPTLRSPPPVRWLDGLLRLGMDASVAEDLPFLMEDGPRTLRRALYDSDGSPISHAAAYLHELVQDGAPPRIVAVVGAVATDPLRRGAGHAARTIVALLGDAAARGAVAAVLWSEVDGLYDRLGFRPAGTELRLYADRARFPSPFRGRVRRAEASDLPSLAELRERTPVRTLRTPDEFRRLLAIPRTEAFVLEEEGRVAAYAVVGRGADLRGVLHEWGGDERRLPDLCGGVIGVADVEELTALAPPWCLKAREIFLARGARVRTSPLCRMKPLAEGAPDPGRLWFSGLDSM